MQRPGQQVGPLTVQFETGWGAWGILDYWAVELDVADGSTPGVYESSGILEYSDWKECQLQGADAGQNLAFTVDTATFDINLPSGGCQTPMNLVERQIAEAYVTNTHRRPRDDHAVPQQLLRRHAEWLLGRPLRASRSVRSRCRSGSASTRPSSSTTGPSSSPFQTGRAPGIYQSAGFASVTDWKECQLQGADAGKSLPLTVNTETFSINLPRAAARPR